MIHKDWHDDFSADRELPLIAKLQQMIDPDSPIPLIGWNAYVVIKKMADKLDAMEAKLKDPMLPPNLTPMKDRLTAFEATEAELAKRNAKS